MAYCTQTISALITSPLQLTMPGTPLKDVHAVSTTTSTASVHGYCGGWQCLYILYVCDEFWEIYHITWYVSDNYAFCKTFPVVCNYSTHDCTLIVSSPDPEMMVVSVMATDHTVPLCPLSVICSVMSVGDLTFHTATV